MGAYSLQQNTFDVWVMLGFGVLGYLFRKVNLPMAPLVLGLILGPAIEKSLRTSLEMSAGDFAILVDRPLSLGLLIASVLVLAVSAFSLAPKALRESEAEV
jgi:putative tricarboxylic transport membrane protein